MKTKNAVQSRWTKSDTYEMKQAFKKLHFCTRRSEWNFLLTMSQLKAKKFVWNAEHLFAPTESENLNFVTLLFAQEHLVTQTSVPFFNKYKYKVTNRIFPRNIYLKYKYIIYVR